MRQACREDLVGPYRRIGNAVQPDDVVEAVLLGIPEQLRERRLNARGFLAVLGARALIAAAIGEAAATLSALYQSALISTGFPRRGVTTQSPTFASIQVSCTPSCPALRSPSSGSA